jgi:hypothetical protein
LGRVVGPEFGGAVALSSIALVGAVSYEANLIAAVDDFNTDGRGVVLCVHAADIEDLSAAGDVLKASRRRLPQQELVQGC